MTVSEINMNTYSVRCTQLYAAYSYVPETCIRLVGYLNRYTQLGLQYCMRVKYG